VAIEIELGIRRGPFPGTVEPTSIAQYAAATNDASAPVLAGEAVPATYPVILVFDALNAGLAGLPEVVRQTSTSGVHGEHDIFLHRALVPGEALETWSSLVGVRNTSAGTRIVVRIEQLGADGALAVEHWWTVLFFGLDLLADIGTEPPDHTFPDDARSHLVGSVTQHVDADIATRYAEVSNDWSAHHFDLDAARRSGVDYLFAHGLCTMGMCAQAAVGLVADGDPARVRRVGVRFASPTRLDEDLTVEVFRAGTNAYAFEAACAGATVVKHGRIELVS
jgi:acyl dehydratase